MLKKAVYETGMVTDGWISIDPTDAEVIENVYKKNMKRPLAKKWLNLPSESYWSAMDSA